jgi:hypothetical protein
VDTNKEEPVLGGAYLTNEEINKMCVTTMSKLCIQQIQALDPNKIYILEVEIDCNYLDAILDQLDQIKNNFGIRFIVIAKDVMKIISVPEGLEVIQKTINT